MSQRQCTQLTNCVFLAASEQNEVLKPKSYCKNLHKCASQSLCVVLFTENEPMTALYHFLENKSLYNSGSFINRSWQTFNNGVQKIQSLGNAGFIVQYIQYTDRIMPFLGTKTNYLVLNCSCSGCLSEKAKLVMLTKAVRNSKETNLAYTKYAYLYVFFFPFNHGNLHKV